MSARGTFTQTVVECIFDAVRLQLEEEQDSNNVRKERLRNHITNMSAFLEVNQASWGKNEDDLVKWTAAAIAWIANIRRHCRAWMLLVGDTPQEFDIEMSGDRPLTFEELTEGVASLRDCIQKASERLANLKAKNRDIEAQVQKLNHTYTPCSVDGRPGSSLEEGEIEQDAGAIRAAQWEQFKEVKNYMPGFVDKGTREWQLHKFDYLERHITSSTPISRPSPRLGDAPLELKGIIATSMRGIKRESDRVFVEVEDDLLRFKATEYARLWKTLECVEEVILGLGPLWSRKV